MENKEDSRTTKTNRPLSDECPEITLSVTEDEPHLKEELPSKYTSASSSFNDGKLSPRNSMPQSIMSEPIVSWRRTISKARSRFGEPPLLIDSAFVDITIPLESDQSSEESIRPSSYRNNIAYSFGTATPNLSRKSRCEIKGVPTDEAHEAAMQLNASLNQKKRGYKLVLQLLVFSCTVGCLVASLTLKRFKSYIWFSLPAWKWFVLLLVVFFGMLIAHWVVKIVILFVQRKFLVKKNAAYMAQGLKTCVGVLTWIIMVLATWVFFFKPHFDQSPKKNIMEFITWSIISVLIGAIMWIIKTAILKMLASSFHLNRFFVDRIQLSIFHHYVLQTLSGPPLIDIGSPFKGNKVVDWGKFPQMNVPTWTARLLEDAVSSSGLSTMRLKLPEDVVEEQTEMGDDDIKSEEDALATALKIFENVARVGNRYIKAEDLSRFMLKEEIDFMLPYLEVNKGGQITRKAFLKWVVKAYNFRMALVHALADTRKTFKQLNRFVDGILILVIFIIWLVLVNISTRKIILIIFTQMVAAAFIFGESCKKLFECIIFVFVVHPYDVGDCCVIDDTPVVIEEMNILTTIVLKSNHERVSYPNFFLATKPISNYTRSPNMGDCLEFSIDIQTPVEIIRSLDREVQRYIEENPCYWHPDYSLVVRDIEDMKKMKMVLRFDHTINFHEFIERSKRRSIMIIELKKIFEKLQLITECKSLND